MPSQRGLEAWRHGAADMGDGHGGVAASAAATGAWDGEHSQPISMFCSKQRRQTYPRCIRLRRRIILEKRGDLGTDATPFFSFLACLSSSSFPFPLSVPFLLKMQVTWIQKGGPFRAVSRCPKDRGCRTRTCPLFRAERAFRTLYWPLSAFNFGDGRLNPKTRIREPVRLSK